MSGKVNFTKTDKVKKIESALLKIKGEIRKVIVGQDEMIDMLLAAILANGHVLLEGVPGIAKTLTARLIAKTMKIVFSRIQFTPDLMPSDIIGTVIYNTKKGVFEFKRGPVFANLVLIDEINRAPAKTQSALFEVMEEKQITVDGKTYIMKGPFMVIATQNPIEYEGTYRLPEAQLDRFFFKINIGYPDLEEEVTILSNADEREDKDIMHEVKSVIDANQIMTLRSIIKSITIEENLIRYIAQLVNSTRSHKAIFLGGSPRASLAIMDGSKALAVIQGRDFVIPEDIKRIAFPALRHRIILTPEKEMEGKAPDDIIGEITESVEVPR